MYCKYQLQLMKQWVCNEVHWASWGQLRSHLEEIVAASVKKTEINDRGNPLRWPRDTLYPQKLALTSPTGGGRSVGIVSSRTKPTQFSFCTSYESSHYAVFSVLLWRCRCRTVSMRPALRAIPLNDSQSRTPFLLTATGIKFSYKQLEGQIMSQAPRPPPPPDYGVGGKGVVH
jgi:hypothetical protein